ncbi:MAG: tetratricopeptide repeat protein [Bacteroidota bacterium]|nr:tetratricopeptide repeat protein [Bacteroidota bacterium]
MGKKEKKKLKQKSVVHISIPQPQKTAVGVADTKNQWPYIIAILLITFVVFLPSLQNGFVNWDDDRNVYENANILELNAKSIKKIFTSDVIGNYNPLPILSFAIEHHFFGMNPKMMHITNLLLHLFCVFFVFKIFRQLGLNLLFAFFGALLFGIHPMRVESVAWITERKDVLFASFFLPALFLYIKNLDDYSKKRSLLIFLLFAIGLFAKIQMVALPLTFLAIDYWKGRTLNFKLVLEKWPYFLAALAFGIYGISVLQNQGSLETNVVHTGISRLFIGSYSFIVYLIKFIIPYPIIPLYPYPANLSVWHYVSLPAALIVLVGLWWAYKKNWRALVFGMIFFIFNIVFLLQILGAGQGYLADRFTYIAYIGLFFTLCYYLNEWVVKKPAHKQLIIPLFSIYLMVFALLSYRQCKIWKDSGTLWTHVIKYYDNTPLPFNNRANYNRDLKLYDQAIKDYNRAIELKAGHATYNSRARLFFNKNEDQKALIDYTKAIELSPKAEYYVNRGAAHAKLGNMDASLKDLNKGLELDPSWKVGYLNRSIIYNQSGNYALALKDIDSYLKYDPQNADLWYEGGRCLRALNNNIKALEYYNRALQLKPNSGLFYLERGKTQKTLGNHQAGNNDFNRASQLGEKVDPGFYK